MFLKINFYFKINFSFSNFSYLFLTYFFLYLWGYTNKILPWYTLDYIPPVGNNVVLIGTPFAWDNGPEREKKICLVRISKHNSNLVNMDFSLINGPAHWYTYLFNNHLIIFYWKILLGLDYLSTYFNTFHMQHFIC